MTNLNIIEKIKVLTVSININTEEFNSFGTGVTVQIDNTLYVMTVAHVIYGDSGEEKPSHKEIDIYLYDNTIQKPSKIENYGNTLLLQIDSLSYQIPDIYFLDKAYFEKQYFVRGFPKATKGKSQAFNNLECIDRETHKIPLKVSNISGDTSPDDAIDKVEGLSGSGVFFEEYGKLYMVGLLNELIDDYGTFETVIATTLVDLHRKNNFTFTKFQTVDKINETLKAKNKLIKEEEIKKFEEDENDNFDNLNRKNSTVYFEDEVLEKNSIRVKQYILGEVAITNLSDIDVNFENKWYQLIEDSIEEMKGKYSRYIKDSSIAQSRLNEITNDIGKSIESEYKYLLDGNSSMVNKLKNYLISKWLLDCNIDFIIKDRDGI